MIDFVSTKKYLTSIEFYFGKQVGIGQMRNWLIGAAILFAAPAHATELIDNGDFTSVQNGGLLVGSGASTNAAAANWKLYNNSNAATFSEVVSSFGGRSNLLHIITSGSDNGAYQMFAGNALFGYADIYIVSGRARFGTYADGGMVALGSALTGTSGVFERLILTSDTDRPFNFVALYSYGEGAEFYIDLASASDFAPQTTPAATGAVPEPATWAMLMVGFGAVGAALRRRKYAAGRAYA